MFSDNQRLRGVFRPFQVLLNPVYMNFGTFQAQRHQTSIKRHIQNYSFLTTRKMLQSAGW